MSFPFAGTLITGSPQSPAPGVWSAAVAPVQGGSIDLSKKPVWQTSPNLWDAGHLLSCPTVSPGRVLASLCRWQRLLTCCVWMQSLSHCELITDDGIRHLGNGACAHDRLEVIELDNCPLITDASLEHLKSCHSLERIELYDCQQITRAGIKRLRVKKEIKTLLRLWLEHFIWWGGGRAEVSDSSGSGAHS